MDLVFLMRFVPQSVLWCNDWARVLIPCPRRSSLIHDLWFVLSPLYEQGSQSIFMRRHASPQCPRSCSYKLVIGHIESVLLVRVWTYHNLCRVAESPILDSSIPHTYIRPVGSRTPPDFHPQLQVTTFESATLLVFITRGQRKGARSNPSLAMYS